MISKNKPSAAQKRRWGKLAEFGCVVCNLHYGVFTPAEIHHCKCYENKHDNVIPLCFHHHRGGVNNNEYVCRHPYKAEFELRYGTEQELLDFINGAVK